MAGCRAGKVEKDGGSHSSPFGARAWLAGLLFALNGGEGYHGNAKYSYTYRSRSRTWTTPRFWRLPSQCSSRGTVWWWALIFAFIFLVAKLRACSDGVEGGGATAMRTISNKGFSQNTRIVDEVLRHFHLGGYADWGQRRNRWRRWWTGPCRSR